jgi:transketolase
MTRSALQAIGKPGQSKYSAGLIDVFELKTLNQAKLSRIIKRYKSVITVEEGFIHKGGLDSLILDLLNRNNIRIPVKSMGFEDVYTFEVGSREYLHKLNNIDTASICAAIAKMS